jgi:ABC-type Fe3+-hydroxamate transport system substrate-binding protein
MHFHSRFARLAAGSVVPIVLGALGACDRAPAAGPSTTSRASSGAESHRAPQRVVPTNTAAAEFLATLLGARGPGIVVAMPEQVDAYACFDFHAGAWASVARFPRYAAESLIVQKPDLVITSSWQSAETTSVLRSQGIDVLVLESAEGRGYDGVRASLEILGKRLGLEAEAQRAIAGLDARVAKLRDTAGPRSNLRAIVYSNDGTGGWTAGAGTTADAFIRLAGLRSAAAEGGWKGHASLDFEKLIGLDPDVVVAGAPARDEGGSPTKSVLEGAPQLARVAAVRNRRIVVLPTALLTTDSPFLVDAAERLAAEVDALLARPAPR